VQVDRSLPNPQMKVESSNLQLENNDLKMAQEVLDTDLRNGMQFNG